MAYVPNWERLRAFTPPTGGETFDEWIAPQRTAAIGRIVEAVGKTPNSEIDLATDIFEAFVETRTKIDPDESSKASNRLTKVKRVQKGLQKQIKAFRTELRDLRRSRDRWRAKAEALEEKMKELHGKLHQHVEQPPPAPSRLS